MTSKRVSPGEIRALVRERGYVYLDVRSEHAGQHDELRSRS